MTKVIVILAVEKELYKDVHEIQDIVSEDFNVVFSGVGKVNAAVVATMCALLSTKDNPTKVYNIGTCGSINHKVGELVGIENFMEWDFDLSSINPELQKGQLIGLPQVFPIKGELEKLSEIQVSSKVLATGDTFVTDSKKLLEINSNIDFIDMEGSALARVCATYDIPFTCIKLVSDNANHEAPNGWEEFLDTSGREILVNLLKRIKKVEECN